MRQLSISLRNFRILVAVGGHPGQYYPQRVVQLPTPMRTASAVGSASRQP